MIRMIKHEKIIRIQIMWLEYKTLIKYFFIAIKFLFQEQTNVNSLFKFIFKDNYQIVSDSLKGFLNLLHMVMQKK